MANDEDDDDFMVLGGGPTLAATKPGDPLKADGRSTNENRGNHHEAQTDEEDAAERDDEEESCCPICFEPWTSSGRHRIVSLKCGHLFGRSCIEKWLLSPATHSTSNQKCPQCNAPAKRQDIRVLFVAKKIVAVDTDGREQLLKTLDEEKKARRLALDREAAVAMQLQVARAELIRLKEELAAVKLERIMSALPEHCKPRYSFLRQISLASPSPSHAEGSMAMATAAAMARCLYVDPHDRVAVVARSVSGANGLVRISLGDTFGPSALSPFLPALQDKPIRAVSGGFFNDGLVAAVGMGSRLHLASLHSGAVVAEWGLAAPGWSVAFDRKDRNLIYAGLGSRRLAVLDIRQTRSPVLEVAVDKGTPPLPVHSLYTGYIEHRGEHQRFIIGATMGGVFVSSADSAFTFSGPSDQGILLQTLQTSEGVCSGLAAAPDGTPKFLASYRHSGRNQQLSFFSVGASEGPQSPFTLNQAAMIDAVSSSVRLQKPCLVNDHTRDQSRLSAAIIDEPSSSVHLWDLDSGNVATRPRDVLSLNTPRPLVDIGYCPSPAADSLGVLLALSEQQLFLYKSA